MFRCWPVKPKSSLRGFLFLGAPVGLRPLAAHLNRWLGTEDTALSTPRSCRPGLSTRDQVKSWLQGWDKGHGELNRCLLGLLGFPRVWVSGQSVVLATTPWASYCLLILRCADRNRVTLAAQTSRNPCKALILLSCNMRSVILCGFARN